jgi:EmrB/QacA subfamily drug resistance transporter
VTRLAALTASAAGAMLVALDGTVLLVAQPSLQHGLRAGVAAVQWTSTGYLLAVAALLVVAGRLGDRYGHRRLLVVGVLGFAAASAGVAVAPAIGWVIGLRVVQGIFGALLQPATLALLRLVYPADRLGAAVAIRTSAIGVAGAAGPVLGGLLVAQWGWRSVFVVNVPVALAVAALVRVPAGERGAPPPIDLGSAVLVAAVLAACVYTLVGVPARGWTGAPTLVGAACTATAAAILVAHQRRAAHPIVPAAVARSAPVTAAVMILLLTTAGLFGALFAATFYLQDVLRLDALAAGLRVLPLTVLMVLGAPVASLLLRRYGPRRTAAAGSVLVVLGVLGMSRLAATGTGTGVVGGAVFAVLGAGFAVVMVTATGTVVGDAPPEYAGVVGGLKQTAMNVGPTLGIAVAASIRLADRVSAVMSARAAGPALAVLAGLAALGLAPAVLLPTRPRTGVSP